MRRLTRIGWVCACVGMLAPAAAYADSVGVMSAVYEASFVRFAQDHEHRPAKAAGTSLFSLCRRCAAPDASPFLVSTNLSPMSRSHNGGFNVVFNGGFAASFGGITFPVPAVGSTTPNAGSPSITLPPADDDPPSASAPSNGNSTAGTPAAPVVTGGVTSNGGALLTKAESLAPTPEPATLLLLGAGLMGIAGGRALRRRT